MIHNGIEYGLMQAYAEGFELMHASAYDIDLSRVASLRTTTASGRTNGR
jgi:6-phosphogluconate dehydrogenase